MSVENHKTLERFESYLLKDNGIGFQRGLDRTVVQEYLDQGSNEPLRTFLGRYDTQEIQPVLDILMKFFVYTQQDDQAAEVFKIADGYTIPDVFYTLLEKEGCSSDVLDSVFRDKKPLQSASDHEKTEYIYNTHARLRDKAEPEVYRKALYALAHGLGEGLKPNKVFNERITEENIDEYLEVSAKNHRKGYTEYFLGLYSGNAKLKEEFLNAVERLKDDFKTVYNPEKRVLINPKWPYDPIAYYRETDPTRRRYAVCHCPWARNAIKEGRIFSKGFCECSVGFNRKTRFGDLEGDLPHEILETVLNGSSRCCFEFGLSEYFDKQDSEYKE